MTKAELIKKIYEGDDIMLDVGDRHFTIFTWTWAEKGINIGEQYPAEPKDQYFATPEELLDNYLIDGVPLGELSEKVVITDYTLSGRKYKPNEE